MVNPKRGDRGAQVLPLYLLPRGGPVGDAHLYPDRAQIAQSDFLTAVEVLRPHATNPDRRRMRPNLDALALLVQQPGADNQEPSNVS